MKFAEFIAPFDSGKFRAEYFGKRPLHISAGKDSRALALGWKRFNELLGVAPYWNEETLKLFFNGREAPRDNYCDTADLQPGMQAPANPAKVKALLGLGASLVANKINR